MCWWRWRNSFNFRENNLSRKSLKESPLVLTTIVHPTAPVPYLPFSLTAPPSSIQIPWTKTDRIRLELRHLSPPPPQFLSWPNRICSYFSPQSCRKEDVSQYNSSFQSTTQSLKRRSSAYTHSSKYSSGERASHYKQFNQTPEKEKRQMNSSNTRSLRHIFQPGKMLDRLPLPQTNVQTWAARQYEH